MIMSEHWRDSMYDTLRMHYARLLSTDRSLLPAWEECVRQYDICQDPRCSFGVLYPNMVNCVHRREPVDLDLLIDEFQQRVINEAEADWLGWSNAYITDDGLLQAYKNSLLRDFIELDDWMNEFLVEYFFGSTEDSAIEDFF